MGKWVSFRYVGQAEDTVSAKALRLEALAHCRSLKGAVAGKCQGFQRCMWEQSGRPW